MSKCRPMASLASTAQEIGPRGQLLSHVFQFVMHRDPPLPFATMSDLGGEKAMLAAVWRDTGGGRTALPQGENSIGHFPEHWGGWAIRTSLPTEAFSFPMAGQCCV